MKHRAPEGALWFSSGSSFGRWNTCDPYLAKPRGHETGRGGPVSNRRQLSQKRLPDGHDVPRTAGRESCGFPERRASQCGLLVSKITCEERRRSNRPIVYGRTREPGGLWIRFCWGNERNPVNSPNPVPTRGMHTRNQATSRAGTVSRSKGASPGKTRVLHF